VPYLGPKWVRLALNGEKIRIFADQISKHFGLVRQMYWNLIWKNPEFVPFGANVTQIWLKMTSLICNPLLHQSVIFLLELCSTNWDRTVVIWPSVKLPFDCQKLDIFSKKIAKNYNENKFFWQFYWKKCQDVGHFLTVKWQFSRGSGCNIELLSDHKWFCIYQMGLANVMTCYCH